MNTSCSAEPCPVILNSTCVFYQGGNLLYTGINTNDSIQTALQKIDDKFQDAGLGYIFQNGLVQSVPGGPVKIGGSLNQNTLINSGGFTFALSGTIESSSFITTGGTSSQFVKGDGSLDNTSYQTAGAYITALTGDGTASGPGSSVFTLANTGVIASTYGNSSTVPRITVDAKGRVTGVVNTAISYPAQLLLFSGDVTGAGNTGANVTLTLVNNNPNVYLSNTALKFAVNNKGLITSAAPLTNLDIFSILGYTPVPQTRTLTINGQTYDLSANRTWVLPSSLPSQTGNAGYWLTTNGTSASWQPLGGNISLFTNNVGYITLGSLSGGTGINYNNLTGVITNSSPDQIVSLTGGTGISTTGVYPNFTITNTAPDQIVSLTAGSSIGITGSYPNFTISYTGGGGGGGTGTVTSVGFTGGTGISIGGTNPITTSGTVTITNSAPDQIVSLTGGTAISVSGSYPNFTVTNAAPDQVVSFSTGSGISVTGTYPSFNLTNTDLGSSQNIFKNIAVNLQPTIVADNNNDTLTVAAGTGIGITTDATTDTLTITNSSPDQVVNLTAGTATTITGSYPNFTIGASYTPVNKAGDTMTGYLILNADPITALGAATKQYVDATATTGIHIHSPVRVETTANLTATYLNGGTTPTVTDITGTDTLTIGAHSLAVNDVIVFTSTSNGLTAGVPYFVYDVPSGTQIRLSTTYGGLVLSGLTNGTGLTIGSRANSGVGATLTNAGPQTALTIDTIPLVLGNRVMVRLQTNGWENGVYEVTNVGSGSTNWELTRAADSNKYGLNDPNFVNEGDYYFTQQGAINAGDSHVLTTSGVIIFGTTSLTYTQFSGAITYTGGTNISVVGQTISLTGQVAVANGGTGASTLTGALIGNGTSAVTSVTGTAGQILRRNLSDTAYEFYTESFIERVITTISANTVASAASNTDYVYLTSGVTTVTLPTAVGNTNRYTIKNVGVNTVTVNTTLGQTIDGSSTITLAVTNTSLDFISNGTNWNVI